MSLDTEKLHKLRGKGFIELHAKFNDKWKAMVDNAFEYAQTCVNSGEKVRIGDVVAIVQNGIKIDPEFEKHLQKKHLTQRYWLTWFAEYIVEQVYPQPELASQPESSNDGGE